MKLVGLNDLLPDKGEPVDLVELGKANADQIGYELQLFKELNSEAAYEGLIQRYKKDIEGGRPHDPRLEGFILEVLQRKEVRAALLPRQGPGAPRNLENVDRDYQLARQVARRVIGGCGKDKARKEVAGLNKVSVSTVRDAYDEYREAAHKAV